MRVTHSGARPRELVTGKHNTKKTLRRCQADGDTAYALISSVIETRPTPMLAMCLRTTPTGRSKNA